PRWDEPSRDRIRTRGTAGSGPRSSPWCRGRWARVSRHQCGSHLTDPVAGTRRDRLAMAEAGRFDLEVGQSMERRHGSGPILSDLRTAAEVEHIAVDQLP